MKRALTAFCGFLAVLAFWSALAMALLAGGAQ